MSGMNKYGHTSTKTTRRWTMGAYATNSNNNDTRRCITQRCRAVYHHYIQNQTKIYKYKDTQGYEATEENYI